MQVLQFCYQLFGGLGAGLAAVENDDVAKLAVERAAPGELHAHRVVGVELQQIEAGNRRGGHIRLVTLRGESPTGVSTFQGLQEHRQGDFPFIENFEISLIQFWCIRR